MSNINQIKGIILAIGHKGNNTPLEKEYLKLYIQNEYKIDSTLLDEINRLAKNNKDDDMQLLSANANKELLQPLINRGTTIYNEGNGRLFVEDRSSPSEVSHNARASTPKKSRMRTLFSRIIRGEKKGGRTRKNFRKRKNKRKSSQINPQNALI